jgi:hypothetical protein
MIKECIIEKLSVEEKVLIEHHILRNEHIYRLGSKKCCYCGYDPSNKINQLNEKNKRMIFEVNFNDYSQNELISFLDDWLEDVKSLNELKIAVRMVLRIIEIKNKEVRKNENFC